MLQLEESPVPISALQHYLFCPRQCALIHVERVWVENSATMEGRLLHETVDSGFGESRRGVRIARGIALYSTSLGLSGRADAVEFRDNPFAVFPVEYKRGKPKSHRADEVQLCAQALCLEEMLGVRVPDGALYYGEKRRRQSVAFDEKLRALTTEIAMATRAMIHNAVTPPARHTSGCRRCSLESLCQPKHFETPRKIEHWFGSRIEQALLEGV